MRARALSTQDGFTIVEVLVSILILAILIGGSLTALISARKATGDQQRRGQAAALAAQDEDRLRSLPVSQLENYSQPANTVTFSTPPGCTAGVGTCDTETFTVTSNVQFFSEKTDSTTCSSSGSPGTADVIATSSSVTWPNMIGLPVTVSSSIAPREGAGLIVQVLNSANGGVSGMTVTGVPANNTTGPDFSGTTGAQGCAYFASLPGGTYNVTVSQSGSTYVNPNGATSQTSPGTVVVGASSTLPFSFDKPGTIQTSFQTDVSGKAQPVDGDTVSFSQSGMSGPRTFGTEATTGQYVSSVSTGATMYPYNNTTSSNYDVWAGSCLNDQPGTNGAAGDVGVGVTPAGSATATVNLPVLDLTVNTGTSTTPGATVTPTHVRLTDTGTGCSGTRTLNLDTAAGTNAYPAPYGTYSLCVDNGTYESTQSITNNNLNGTAETFYLGSQNQTGTKGTCS